MPINALNRHRHQGAYSCTIADKPKRRTSNSIHDRNPKSADTAFMYAYQPLGPFPPPLASSTNITAPLLPPCTHTRAHSLSQTQTCSHPRVRLTHERARNKFGWVADEQTTNDENTNGADHITNPCKKAKAVIARTSKQTRPLHKVPHQPNGKATVRMSATRTLTCRCNIQQPHGSPCTIHHSTQ